MTPESLIRTHQDGVYTVCLHVLRHPQDAEDAAQEALLKIAAGAPAVREPRAFKSWLYRVTWHTAVDHLRKRATRRRIEEGSAPMTPSLTEEQREAIHEAMAALPDDDRLLLVEHYFEKSTLAELGRREGISDVAMGKRVDKARERLKRGLAGAGILIASSQVAQALESVEMASAPSGLVGSALAAGGIVMGVKSMAPVLIAVALLFLGLGGLGGYVIASKRTIEPARPRDLASETAASKSAKSEPKDEKQIERSDAVPPAPPSKASLGQSLERYKAFKDRNTAKWKAWSAANPGKGIDPRELSKDSWALFRELEGIREQIAEDPETFLNFLRRAENEPYVWNLFDVTLVRMQAEGYIRQQGFTELPRPLMDGLLDLLKTGSGAVRSEILGFMRHVTDQPDEFKRGYLDLLSDPNPHIIKAAAGALSSTSSLTPEEFRRLTAAFDQSPVREVRQAIVHSMWRIQTPESRDWRLSALESGSMPDLDADLAMSLMTHVRDGLGEAFEDRFVGAVAASLRRTSDEAAYFNLLQSTRMLPFSKSKAHYEMAAASGPTPKIREAAARCVELIKDGKADWKSVGTILNEAQAKQ